MIKLNVLLRDKTTINRVTHKNLCNIVYILIYFSAAVNFISMEIQ